MKSKENKMCTKLTSINKGCYRYIKTLNFMNLKFSDEANEEQRNWYGKTGQLRDKHNTF